MQNGQQKRTRSQRVAALELPPGMVDRFVDSLQRAEVLWRIALCIVAALVMWCILGGWAPPFPYRLGYTPSRDIDAKVSFQRLDAEQTREAKQKAASQAIYVYTQDAAPLVQLRAALKNAVAEVGAAANLNALRPKLWDEFYPPPGPNSPPISREEQDRGFQKFHGAVDSKEERTEFGKAVDRSFAELEEKGFLAKLEQTADQGNQTEIQIHPTNVSAFPAPVPVSEVLFGEAMSQLHNRLRAELGSPEIADRVFFWLTPKLTELSLKNPTLKKDADATNRNIEQAKNSVADVYKTYNDGRHSADGRGDLLAKASQPLDGPAMRRLRLEYLAELAQLTTSEKLDRSAAVLGMFAALFGLCGIYIFARNRSLLSSLRRFATLLALCVVTVALCKMAGDEAWMTSNEAWLDAGDAWRAELIPLLLFAMTVAIAYHQELALLLSAAMSLVVVLGLGQGLPEYVTLLSASATAIFLLGRIRTRSKLIYVGLCCGAVAVLTSIGVHVLDGQPLNYILLREAGRFGLCSIAAGFLMTGMLPFIEKTFGVLTDISLLEIGDIAHPLLQELVRRAPGTYNHSINVASIAEAAAESIGAHGLLVRVGAYFHDIGKMLKPGYFVENQGTDADRHQDLLPAMSTLIIIAHIKDGADLARQHHLPKPIIDFILQHHGTTLVEYFYRRANRQSEADPNAAEVDESSYRYPGPKPATKEAAVMMVADAVESASRALVEPAPARIEALVHEIALKRLLDGQFDDCGLTLQELQVIEESLVKSLTAVYHGRVKYPDQQTA